MTTKLWPQIASILIIVMFASACGFSAAATQTIPTLVPVQATALPTQTATAVPQPTPTSTTAPKAALPAQGFVLFDGSKGEFNGYALDGSPLFTSAAPGVQYPSSYSTEVVNGAVYFLTDQTKQVLRSSPGRVEQVNIPTANLFAFAVSPDEKQIAWSTMDPQNGASELWIASRDGSGARQVAQYNAKQSPIFLFIPLEWTADGRLLFDRTITGVGGYILFGGHNSLYSYASATGEFTTFVPAEERHGLCLDSYRLDLDKIAFNCGQQQQAIIVRDLVSQKETILPTLPSQGLAGSARYSPSGKWLAYATAAHNPEDESGQVVVVPADLSTAPTAIAQVADNSFAYVQGWLDEDTLLFSRYTNMGSEGTVWSVKKDGSELKQMATGSFIGWIR